MWDATRIQHTMSFMKKERNSKETVCQKAGKGYSPSPSDSNKQVSPTPTSRHHDRKLAVLSRAKKEPDGALALHGILRLGIGLKETNF